LLHSRSEMTSRFSNFYVKHQQHIKGWLLWRSLGTWKYIHGHKRIVCGSNLML
jgi:hypothetical protein